MRGDELTGAIEAEQKLLDPGVRRDPVALAELLDEDFVEIGASGRLWTRAGVIDELVHGTDRETADALTTSDWTVREIAPGVALVGFVSERAGRRVRRTSLYRLEDGAWRAVFHQGTPES